MESRNSESSGGVSIRTSARTSAKTSTSIGAFNPNAQASSDSGIFGLPFSAQQSQIHIIPVPWEVTTSYGNGTSRGPEAVLQASHQVDLFDLETGDVYRNGYHLFPISEKIKLSSDQLKTKANLVSELGESNPKETQILQDEINQGSRELNDWVYNKAREILSEKKFPALLGGDHSTPYGLIRALSEKYSNEFGILHIDAHADLRKAYQGYENSHASIMYNVMENLKPNALVQVGIRDFCEEEFNYIQSQTKIHTFFDITLKSKLLAGESWKKICNDIVAKLPKQVYISFDIDGLNPDLCPNTGTPVPGGLSFNEALLLFSTLVESGRRIIGFDLNEVGAPEDATSDWDGNVGARILFKLCGWLMISNGFQSSRKI